MELTLKDAYYFKHDSNARNDPKIQALIEKYGVEGYGRFFIIIEMMRESSHYRLEDKPYVLRSIANQFKINIEQTKVFLDDCVSEFSLLEFESSYYFSRSFLERMNHLDDVRQKRQEAGRKRHQEN